MPPSKLSRALKTLFVTLMLASLFALPALAQEATLDEVVILQGVDPGSLDPHDEATFTAAQIFFEVFDSLIHRNAALELVPGLAASWDYVDARTVRFHLQQGVTWHNGDPFTADDVSYSLERMMNPELRATVYWGPIVKQLESWVIEDPYTITLTWKEPNAAGLLDIGRQKIVPMAYIEEVGNAVFGENPIGTGPYTLEEWVKGERVVLQRYPDFWGETPAIQSLVFRAVPDASTRVAELLAGSADIITGVSSELAPTVESSEKAHVSKVRSGRNAYVVLDQRQPPFDDVRVRQAMNYAVNVDEIIEFVMGGLAYRSAGPLASANFGFDPDLAPYPYDPERARELLAEAGYPNGFEIDFSYGPGRWVKDGEVAEAIAAQLATVGITAKLLPLEWGVFSQRRTAGELTGMHLISLGTLGDPDIQLKYLQSDRNGAPYMQLPEIDELVRKQVVTVDPDARAAVLKDTQRLAHDLAPWVFLFDLEDVYGVSDRLDWEPWPSEDIWLRDAGPAE